MEWNSEQLEQDETTRRIVMTLLALAALADRAGAMPLPIRCVVIWILRAAQNVAWAFVAEFAPAPLMSALPSVQAGTAAADAVSLGISLRALAYVIGRLFPRVARGRSRVQRTLNDTRSRALGGLVESLAPGGACRLGNRLNFDTS